MMREILGVAHLVEARRRWFHDEYFDLFVWQKDSGEITLFQLCYGIDTSERALVWDKDKGYFHDGMPSGAAGGEIIGATLAQGLLPEADPVMSRLDAAMHSLPEDIRRTVYERVLEFAEKQVAVPTRRQRFRRADWQKQPVPDSETKKK